MNMKKEYITPECEAFKLSAVMPLAASPEIGVYDEEPDEGGWSKQWGGSIFDDDKSEE